MGPFDDFIVRILKMFAELQRLRSLNVKVIEHLVNEIGSQLIIYIRLIK